MKFLKPLFSIFLISQLLGTQALAAMDVINFNRDGKTIQIQDDHSKRVTDVKVQKGEKVHTAKAYGTMYLSFLASMIATEIWYCNKGNLQNISDFEETPTCRDELYQMMLDPSMHAGIFAMTYTSLTVTSFADRHTKNVLQKVLKSKAEKPIAILQTFWQSIGMGMGISVQTIINSTYNSPSLPQCMGEIKKAIIEEDSTTEEAMKSKICQEAYAAFVSFETGTMSEITIAMYSLAISTAATMAVMTSIRVVGMVFLGASPQGWLFRGGLFVANGLIEFFDRAMETTVRKYYHIWRSEGILEENVTDLIKSLEAYESTGSLIGTKTVRRRTQMRAREQAFEQITSKNFNLLDDLQDYNKNIDYRRRAKLNTFIDSQSRWKQKLSGISEIYSLYKEFLKTVIEIRQERAAKSDMMLGSDSSYNSMSFIGLQNDELETHDVKRDLLTDSSHLFISEGLRTALTRAVEEMVAGSKNVKGTALTPYTIPVRSHGLDLMRTVLKQLAEEDYPSLRVNLWRLKGYMEKFHGPDKALGGRDRQSVVDNLNHLLEGVSSFTPATAYGLIQFEKSGMVGTDPLEKLEKAPEGNGERVARKRGASISTESVDVLQAHPHISSMLSHSPHKLANLLIHSVCNPNLDIIYDYNDGDVSKVTLPSMLKLPTTETYNCIHRSKHPSDRADLGATEDHYYNPESGKLVRVKTNQALQSVFIKDGQEYLGLIDLLTSPEVEIRWNTLEELNDYWSSEVVPGYLDLLGQGKMNYQNFLIQHFKLFSPDSGFFASFLESDAAATTPENLNPFNNKSFRNRDLENYYENMKSGQAFLDQIRMVQHLYKTIGVENERSKFLTTYFTDLKQFLKALDVTAYLNIEPTDTYVLRDISINPMLKLLGMDKYVELVKLNGKISQNFAKLSEDLKDVPEFQKNELESLTEQQAKLILEKVAFDGLYNMYKNAVFGEIFTDYLTGDGFIYSKELDTGIRNGTHIE